MRDFTPLTAYLAKAGGTMSGNIAMAGYKVTGLGAPAVANDALIKGTRVTAAELLDGTALYVLKGQGVGSSPAFALLGSNALSDAIAGAADTERTDANTDGVYRKNKEIQVPQAGNYRVDFELRSYGAGSAVFGRIYKNGAAVGTERSTTLATYTTYTEDFTGLAVNDFIQLYTKSSLQWQVFRNFRVKASIAPPTTVTLD